MALSANHRQKIRKTMNFVKIHIITKPAMSAFYSNAFGVQRCTLKSLLVPFCETKKKLSIDCFRVLITTKSLKFANKNIYLSVHFLFQKKLSASYVQDNYL